MDTALTVGQVLGILSAVMGPVVAALVATFWQMRASDKRLIDSLERTLLRSETQADTLLPALREQIIAGNTSIALQKKDLEELRGDLRATREELRTEIRSNASRRD